MSLKFGWCLDGHHDQCHKTGPQRDTGQLECECECHGKKPTRAKAQVKRKSV